MNFRRTMPWGGMSRCIVNPNHSVEGYLNEDNSNLWQDGTEVDWTAVEAAGQNVMVEIPKFYFAKKVVGDARIFGVAGRPAATEDVSLEEWEVHPAFFRDRTKLCDDQTATPIEVSHRYAPAFKGWVDSQGSLRSLPNKLPTTNKTIGVFRNHAKNMGVGWSQTDYYLHSAIQMLYITEYGNPNSQETIGMGWTGAEAATQTGGTLAYGNNTHGSASAKEQISYRGIEDFWGNVRSWVDGYLSDASCNVLIGNKGFNNTGVGYENFGNDGNSASKYGNTSDIHSNKHTGFTISKFGMGEYETKGLRDYSSLTPSRLPYVGGCWSGGLSAGVFLLRVDGTATSTLPVLGASLSL